MSLRLSPHNYTFKKQRTIVLKKAREEKHLTQAELAELVDKKREYISRIENNGSNLTLKTLFDIVERGLGGKINISIEF